MNENRLFAQKGFRIAGKLKLEFIRIGREGGRREGGRVMVCWWGVTLGRANGEDWEDM